MEITRLHRVLKLLTLLQTGRSFNAGQLASQAGVCRRTVYRDLAAIEKAGLPVFFDHATGGYQIHEIGLLPQINFTLEEALAIVLLAAQASGPGAMPLMEPAHDAAAKIEASLPLGMRAVMGGLAKRIAVRPPAAARHKALTELYHVIQRSIIRRQTLEAVYISFHDEGQIRTRLEPYWLMFNERAWYVIGFSSEHGAVRTFKLGRFKKLQPTDARFDAPAGLTLESHLGNAWRMMRGDKTYAVKLLFSPLVSPNVAEVNWHRTQKVEWDDDGRVHFTVTVDGLEEIVWWVLGYGPEVEVLEPPELRERLAGLARRMLALYKGT